MMKGAAAMQCAHPHTYLQVPQCTLGHAWDDITYSYGY